MSEQHIDPVSPDFNIGQKLQWSLSAWDWDFHTQFTSPQQ